MTYGETNLNEANKVSESTTYNKMRNERTCIMGDGRVILYEDFIKDPKGYLNRD